MESRAAVAAAGVSAADRLAQTPNGRSRSDRPPVFAGTWGWRGGVQQGTLQDARRLPASDLLPPLPTQTQSGEATGLGALCLWML